ADASSRSLKIAGYHAGRALLTMPWRSLEPMCRRFVSDENDVVDVWVSYFIGLVASDLNAEGAREGKELKVMVLQDCVRAIPGSGELRLFLCRFLLESEGHREAYDAALEALPLTATMVDRHAANQLLQQLVICIDNAAFGQIPRDVLQPSSREGL